MYKKLLNLLMVLLIGMFIYNNYIRKEEKVNIDLNSDIETTNVQYNFKNYLVEADKQTDVSKEEKQYFDKAKAFFKESIVKGKKAVVDKLNNMTLTGDILGINEKAGWSFETDKIKYLNKKDILYTDSGIKAYNKKEGITIYADKFESDSKLINMKLKNNVKGYFEDKELYADKADYNSKTQILKLSGNIRIKNKNLDNNPDFKEIKGNFEKAVYNMKKGVLTVDGEYEVFYDSYLAKAKKLTYFEKKEKLVMEKDVRIFNKDMTATMPKAEYYKLKNKIYLFGRIKGANGEIEFEADKGEVNTLTENIDLKGNILVYDDSSTLNADEVFYDKTRNLIKAYADKGKNIIFENEDGKVVTDYVNYSYDKGILKAPNKFEVFGNKFNGKGNNLVYDTNTKNGTAENLNFDGFDRNIVSEKGKFNLNSEKHWLYGNVRVTSENYILMSESALIDRRLNKITIPNEYTVIDNTNKDSKIIGKNLVYDVIPKLIYSDQKTNLYRKNEKENIEIEGTSFTYNLLDEMGTFENPVAVEKNNDFKIQGKKGIYQAEKNIKIYGDVEYFHDQHKGNTSIIIYDLSDEKVYIPKTNTIVSLTKELKGTTEKGIYDVNTQIFSGEIFVGNTDKSNMKSDKIEYNLKTQIAKLTGNVTVEENGLKAESQEIIYYRLTNFAVSEQKVVLTKGNAKMVSDDAKLDMTKQTFEANKAEMSTINGDFFKGDYLYGDYLKNEFNVRGNLEATVYTRNEEELNNKELAQKNSPMKFSGDIAKIYFIELPNKDMLISRGEIKKNTEFKYKDMVMNSQFLEFDTAKKNVFGKGNSILTLANSDKVSANSIYLNTETEEGTMKENVKIFNTSEEVGDVNTRADIAHLNNKDKKIDLTGNVEAYKGETKLVADRGVYDLNTNLLQGKGNVFFTFDFETLDQQKAKKERTKKLKEKIGKAKEKLSIPKEIDENTKKIELPNRIDEVSIIWESDNKNYLSNDGTVVHPFYDKSDEAVSLKATFTASDITENNYYFTVIKKHSKESYLNKISSEFDINVEGNKLLIPETYKGVQIKMIPVSSNIDEAMELPEDLEGNIEFELIFALENKFIEKKYRSKYEKNILTFEEVDKKNE